MKSLIASIYKHGCCVGVFWGVLYVPRMGIEDMREGENFLGVFILRYGIAEEKLTLAVIIGKICFSLV